MLVDSHCHLDRLNLDPYEGQLDQALAAAHARDIQQLLCISISLDNVEQVIEIARQHPSVLASVGVHPCDVSAGTATRAQLTEWAGRDKVVAIGETGLDYYHETDSIEEQKASFALHLEVAGEVGLPVVVHTRAARQDTLDLIKAHGNPEHAGVLHCFTESWEMAQAAMEMNYYISLSGIVTFKNAKELQEVARKMPLDRLLVETDSPYLAPVPYRGKPNEPQYVREVAEFVADLKGISYAELADITTENFYQLFSRAQTHRPK